MKQMNHKNPLCAGELPRSSSFPGLFSSVVLRCGSYKETRFSAG
jgi:hypothetical protein